jgi:hypothetical protein
MGNLKWQVGPWRLSRSKIAYNSGQGGKVAFGRVLTHNADLGHLITIGGRT